ncbi:hypothetical protein [Paenibacillus luteus]|uniref:hypothetical protein n=1 Tax=Paenibacillus luteus TaxID=2545753 RepID=UPI00114504CC|nr:hypothetical protein [Paenibacillus luteus]
MSQSIRNRMAEEQRYLVDHAMEYMDQLFDEDARMLRDAEQLDRHNTRGSGHYAVGLLLRNEPGDWERAAVVLNKVIDMQLNDADEIYFGTFRASPQASPPPKGKVPWQTLGAGSAYRYGEDVLPPVWRSYDPNWREFVACTFAVILENFESVLPAGLVARMDDSMVMAVTGSIDRRLTEAVPMNSNIELMHIFIAHYFGQRFGNKDWLEHAKQESYKFHAAFMEFGSLAEFNTTTYYGVDITVLGLWRCYAKCDELKRIGHDVEKGLWESIALFYNPVLQNLSGPFARAYEMEMLAHSSMGVFLYLLLGKGFEHLAAINCESEHDPIIALVGIDIPEYVKPSLAIPQGERLAVKKFRELCEQDLLGENSNLCTAKAWIEKDVMLGGMSGSKNTNGQMHPATIHWITKEGQKYYLRLLRREVGGHWNTHERGIIFEADVKRKQLSVEVYLDTAAPVEIYFEISGGPLDAQLLSQEHWSLPGLALAVDSQAPLASIHSNEELVEVIYIYQPGETPNRMSFTLTIID